MSRAIKRSIAVLAAAGLATLIVWALRPQPLAVQTARVVRGSLQVTIDEDGATRAHDRYTLAAPIAGRLSRIELREGAAVTPRTVIATISPVPIDPREAAQTRAEIATLEARRQEADAYVARAEADHQQASRDAERFRALYQTDDVSRQALEQAETAERRAAKELAAARFKVQSTDAEIARARAGLMSLEEQRDGSSRLVTLRPPAAGRILQILEKSERVVAAGTPLVVLSNPNRIEAVVDLLSTDAVRIKAGAAVSIEGWGGAHALRARVRLVEPYGFTKVSALGIEEQRVNVVVDFLDPPQGLGDGYRVEARIVIWESPDVLKAPGSALFRARDGGWSVLVIEDGRAHTRPVEVDHRNAFEAEITGGLREGEEVIVHPSNDLEDGMRVTSR
jgi:HlyD family secretion protein